MSENGVSVAPLDLGNVEATFDTIASDLSTLTESLRERRAVLAAQLDELDTLLDRVEGSLEAIQGRTPARPAAPPAARTRPARNVRRVAQDNRERVLEIARTLDGPFRSSDIASEIGMSTQGIGPIMSALVRDGKFEVVDDDGTRRSYRLVR